MTRIIVDRDSVAMGDDAVSHRQEVEVGDDATAFSLVHDVLRRHYLPSVRGTVSWMARIAPVRTPLGTDARPDGAPVAVALVTVPVGEGPAQPWVVPLDRMGRRPLSARLGPGRRDEVTGWLLHFTYHSDGCPVSLTDFGAGLVQPPA